MAMATSPVFSSIILPAKTPSTIRSKSLTPSVPSSISSTWVSISHNKNHYHHLQSLKKSDFKVFSSTTEVVRETVAKKPSKVLPFRVGHGFDLHRLEPGYPLIIGGINIPHDRGCEAHSDGDVLLHCVVDAILGALGLPDIGQIFPDNDPKWKGAASSVFIKEAVRLMDEAGYEIGNLDATLILQRPKVSPHKENIRANLSELLGADPSVINLKAKTHEKVDSLGENRSIAAHTVVLLMRKDYCEENELAAEENLSQKKSAMLTYLYADPEQELLIPNLWRSKRETATTSKKLSVESPSQFRIGHGFDIQKLVSAYPWVIGGQYIRYSLGCEAYPKVDVLYQSVVDAILGALGLPDAEEMFPWSDPKWDGASSVFLAEAVRIMNFAGYEIGNLDTTLILQEPYLQLSAIKETIKTNLSRILGVDVSGFQFQIKSSYSC